MRRHPTKLTLQVHQPHAVEVLVVAYSLGWPKGPLASTSHMLRKTVPHVGVDLPKPFARVPVTKVVCPASEVTVQLFNQLRQRHRAPLFANPLLKPPPLLLQSLLRYGHVEIPVPSASQITIITKRVPQKVKLLSRLPKLITRVLSRLISSPIQPSIFDSIHPPKLFSLIACQHHKIIGVAHPL